MNKFLISFIFLTVGYIQPVAAQINPAEARQIAKDAYIFSYPLMMNYRLMYRQAIDTQSPTYTGGFGKMHSFKKPATPDDKYLVNPNIDTPYTWAWVDLRSEPWVLIMPAIDSNRYYSSQWDDLWGFVLDSPGSIKDGNDGDNYLLTDTNWKGAVPTGINRVIRGESVFLGSLTRTEFFGGEDLPNVNMIQQHYELIPLSTYLKKPNPAVAPIIHWLVWNEGSEKTIDAFKYVNFILPFTLAHQEDKAMLDSMKAIGIEGGKSWEPQKFPADIQEAIKQGIDDAIQQLEQIANQTTDTKELFADRTSLMNHYLDRAVGVYTGIFGNSPEQAIYSSWNTDAKGRFLDGSKRKYTLTFPKNGMPPVNYFWSMTMYSLPSRGLVTNSIKRYGIGNRTKGLQMAADGTLTIYIQADSPGKDKESNWLPAPTSPFFIILRSYGPDKSIINGAWKQPTIVGVDLPPPPKVVKVPVKKSEEDHEQVKVDEAQHIDSEFADESEPVSDEPSAELASPDIPYHPSEEEIAKSKAEH